MTVTRLLSVCLFLLGSGLQSVSAQTVQVPERLVKAINAFALEPGKGIAFNGRGLDSFSAYGLTFECQLEGTYDPRRAEGEALQITRKGWNCTYESGRSGVPIGLVISPYRSLMHQVSDGATLVKETRDEVIYRFSPKVPLGTEEHDLPVFSSVTNLYDRLSGEITYNKVTQSISQVRFFNEASMNVSPLHRLDRYELVRTYARLEDSGLPVLVDARHTIEIVTAWTVTSRAELSWSLFNHTLVDLNATAVASPADRPAFAPVDCSMDDISQMVLTRTGSQKAADDAVLTLLFTGRGC